MLVKVEAYDDGEFWCARGVGEDMFTQGKTLDDLMENIREAASLHFEDQRKLGESLHVLILSDGDNHP
jgi:predicted RNase H-like HicB family nuclease